jgi:hypothetical protein
MRCEECSREIDVVVCGACGRSVLRLGPFCCHCGRRLENEAGQQSDEEPDFSNRVLCSDGTCIGIINEQGTCKVCGKPYTPES